MGNLKASMIMDRRNFAEALKEEVSKSQELASLLTLERKRNESWKQLYDDKCNDCDTLLAEIEKLTGQINAK